MDLQFLLSSCVEIIEWVGIELTIPCVVAIIVTSAFYSRYKNYLAVKTARRSYPNFARCSAVVIEVFPKIMQELLANHQIKAKDLYKTVLNHRDFKTILNGNEMDTIESLNMTDGFSKLNFTLIYKILKFNFIKSLTHKWGTMPLENEIEIGDDVERMRFARQNLVYRIDLDMQNSEFETFFTDFVQLGKRVDIHLKKRKIFGFQRDIEYFKTCPMDNCQQKEYIEAIKDPEYLKGTSFSLFSEKSKHLSAYLNAFKISLPLAKIQQDSVRISNDINKICSDVLESPETICVGSVAEGLNVSSSDYDMISFANDSDLFKPKNLKPIPEKGHPGYSKLLVKCIGTHNELIKYTHLKEGIDHCPNGLSMHGPAYNTVLWEPHAEALFQHGETKDNRLDVDFVLCIKINEWPLKTFRWKTRSRASNWPTKKMLRNIKNAGYFLAAVGSKESNDSEMQWRVSFNKAEQLIIESFNETQLHCIFLLKLMKNYISDIAGKNISSYTMKIVMFWCLKETSDKYWHSSNLLCCFIFCVSKLKSFVENEFLPNFFIRERNQFIMSEFTRDKNNVLHYLESFLDDPTSGINLLLPPYREHAITYQICTLNIGCLRNFIIRWLEIQIAMACNDQFNLWAYLLMLYDGKPIKCIFKHCNKTLKKLKKVEYTQALRKKLQNYMGVLQYILLIEQKEKGEDGKDTRTKYFDYMELSATGDLTHNTLRIATCYLHDDVKKDCLSIIQKVTESNGNFYMTSFRDRLKQTIYYDIEALKQREHEYYKMYNGIINNIDFEYHDPYRTFCEFEKIKERGCRLIGYNSLRLAWKRCYFDVTFMRAELPVLPDPAAVELCIDKDQKSVSFHPFLYGLLLEFLWHEKHGSGHEDKESVLNKMKNCLSIIPNEQKSIGLNFMAYCYSLQKIHRAAFMCQIQSLKLNPLKTNVAYLYMKYKLKKLRE